ncbi:hypothetical protein ROZALSC1DRAFT_22448 [Rozella allomycis CSF55]|uniref:Uncharacterized protein n=1 Tax=Rozella allomycis (strain CSF55) TaxID=988480 RepID=A0A4P9YIN3_ROZAC|nr:hypothetical protein ROZALSC1DRAFT_22448 [Rozella allomycis CSF55]
MQVLQSTNIPWSNILSFNLLKQRNDPIFDELIDSLIDSNATKDDLKRSIDEWVNLFNFMKQGLILRTEYLATADEEITQLQNAQIQNSKYEDQVMELKEENRRSQGMV